MLKEKTYQDSAQNFIESTIEKLEGRRIKILEEGNSTQFNKVLQECSPIVGGFFNDNETDNLKNIYGVVGLREKIKEFNLEKIQKFISDNKLNKNVDYIVELIYQDFVKKYKSANETSIYQLIFSKHYDVKEAYRRTVYVDNLELGLDYNVVYYEDIRAYKGKNSFYTIRERRIPTSIAGKSERPDFMLYINGIPLILVEYKTEITGLLESIKDFEYKETYSKAPFKIGLNNGSDVLFFSNIEFLKYGTGKDSSFQWVHYLPEKKYVGSREYLNIEYLMEELFCQPENLYNYCVHSCSVVNQGGNSYLINARIQQYYAIKDTIRTLKNVLCGIQAKPYNFEYAHAQRSGKTITMKLISYLIERQCQDVFNRIFMYTPDLQIKEVINNEFSKSGNSQVTVVNIESRSEFIEIIKSLHKMEEEDSEPTGLTIYVVNMQKISDEQLQSLKNDIKGFVIESDKVLNIIDEAHHGQTKETALTRDKIFPNASNYLFTATGKEDMYAYYFYNIDYKEYRNVFTISNAKECMITVPVLFLKALKTFSMSDELSEFTAKLEERFEEEYLEKGKMLGIEITEEDKNKYLVNADEKTTRILKTQVRKSTIQNKLDYIICFLSETSKLLPFKPKAIVYVDSVQEAREYIEYIQQFNKDNWFGSYRFGVDFSAIKEDCSKLNPNITNPEDISVNFQKDRTAESKDDNLTIDILIAVDKYQKGFDLPSLLVTYLDTNIGEPARMNQIYTRTATKFPGKTTGYCVDLTFENTNEETFLKSLELYDSKDGAKDNFLNQDKVNSLVKILNEKFYVLKKALGLSDLNFTKEYILDVILNEPNLQIREDRQYDFFIISKDIAKLMSQIGSPMFFKPFALELIALNGAVTEFKKIYADKTHVDNHKIIIDMATESKDNKYISPEEIKSAINQVMQVMNILNIKELVELEYKNERQEIKPNELVGEINKKWASEQSKNNLEYSFNNLKKSLNISHPDLFKLVTTMLYKISEDRTIIYKNETKENIDLLLSKLEDYRKEISNTIETKFNGNKYLYFADQESFNTLSANNINDVCFISYVAQKVDEIVKTILPQIEITKTTFDKVEDVFEMFVNKTSKKTFSPYIVDYINSVDKVKKQNLIEEVKLAPKINGKLMAENEEIFESFLKESLKTYFNF